LANICKEGECKISAILRAVAYFKKDCHAGECINIQKNLLRWLDIVITKTLLKNRELETG
jgi:hypothetical protein